MIDTVVGTASASTSDPTANLLSGLIGAIIGAILGGGLTLLGSVIVNRMERRTQARQQLYIELVPDAVERIQEARQYGSADEVTLKYLSAIRRLGVIAGKHERELATRAFVRWRDASTAGDEQDFTRMGSAMKESHVALGALMSHLQRRLD